jgi:prophage maintenance system killer protein
MTDLVHYHHPDDEQYSLAYVTLDPDEINPDDGKVETYHLDETVHVLFTNSGASGTIDELSGELEAKLDEMSEPDRLVTMRILQTFEGVLEAMEVEEGEKLEIYKQIEVDRIPAAIEHVDWSRPVVEVAGQLMSSLILAHPLPNANHRTSIGFAEWYLESDESSFSLPKLATDTYDWREWVDPYIVDSKRLLTVRRNTAPFRLLDEWGCDVVLRKGGIEIGLAEYDLEMPQSKALSTYAAHHTDLCIEFMIESVTRAGAPHLRFEQGLDKEAFLEYLETTE